MDVPVTERMINGRACQPAGVFGVAQFKVIRDRLVALGLPDYWAVGVANYALTHHGAAGKLVNVVENGRMAEDCKLRGDFDPRCWELTRFYGAKPG